MDIEQIIKQAEQGDLESLVILAFMHETNRFPYGSDPLKALELYERMANPPYENGRAMLRLGMIYCLGKCESGSIGAQDFRKGRDYIRKGFDKIDIENPLDIKDCVDLGFFIGQGEASVSGRSNAEDIKFSIKFLEKAMRNKEAIKQFAKPGQEDEYVNHIKDYLDNRKELLESEEDLDASRDDLPKKLEQIYKKLGS